MPHPSRRSRAAVFPLALALLGATSLMAGAEVRSADGPSTLRAEAGPQSGERAAALRRRVVRTFRQVQERSDRLGLDRPRRLTLARRPQILVRQLQHWGVVSDFLAGRSELDLTERAGKPSGDGRARAIRDQARRAVVAHYGRVVRRAEALGVSRPRPLRLARSPRVIERQREHWRSVSEFLGARRELRRGEELTPRWNAWMCIHGHEGAWESNTGNGYYGGLQMDWSFMHTYGGRLLAERGTADNWTPVEQVLVADLAWQTRGFRPWPNTARACGLR